MGYLICDKCGVVYHLKSGESPHDFSGCSCGGDLSYVENLHSNNILTKNNRFKLVIGPKLLVTAFSVLIFIVAMCMLGFINLSSNVHGVNSSSLNSDYFADVQAAPSSASDVVLGATYIEVPQGATVVTQVDRVTKDPVSKINNNLSTDFKPQSSSELIPYMEGARVKELMKYARVKVVPATNVPVKRINNTWYGPDDEGHYVYAVDPGKMTDLRSKKVSSDTRMATTTHGMNVMVPEAVKSHASLVVACGDLPAKALAESYMNTKGINCYAPCDRFTFQLLNQNSTGTSLGTMPIRALKNGKGAVIGAQPIEMDLKEKIIVQTTVNGYPDQYCDTPNRYFDGLEKTYGLKLNKVIVDANVGQTNKVVEAADKNGANIIAVRVLNNKDKAPVRNWLKKNPNHRAILFHSAAYEPGYSLFFEFPRQVTGDDTKPVFINDRSTTDVESRFNKVRSLWQ